MKVAVVTGANGQLGMAFVQTLVNSDYHVYALDLKIDNIKKENNLTPVCLDITREKDVHEFYNLFTEIDILVNNAGIGVFTKFEDRTAEEFENVMKVNLLGTFLMSQGALKLMKVQSYGKIINVGSIYGVVSSDERIYGDSGRNNSEVYSATKSGVIHMTKYMAAHFGKYNIQVNCISPGGIFNNQSSDFKKNYEYKTPMGRLGNPEDLQSALKYLISDETKYTNGINIIVDGGFCAW
ncbi:MAG: short-chain dehydrogenase [Spirochaetae bacterium HGW-Spirochaetae-5]|nr:MAG: short-chain dehydrogenase [Spirochaetae bacterium HGW-Spirochaetae-5]